MYPDFRYLLQGITGHEMPLWLGLFKTFGLMVALAFIAAAWATGEELKRKEKQGLLLPRYVTTIVGKPYSIAEIIISAITGFILFYKIGGVFGHVSEVSQDPMKFLLSLNGSFLFGLAGCVLFCYTKYTEGKKQELPKPKEITTSVYPHSLIMEIVMVAAIAGLTGSKLFNAFETWDDFIQHPIQNLVSSSGLTFFGGLILATTCFYFFARKHKIPFPHLCDSAAPGIMLAYGIGRLGCQFAGDGDWGIYNTAYVSDEAGATRLTIDADKQYISNFLHQTNAPFTNFKAPSWLPDWLVGMTYPHNVGNEGRMIQGYIGEYHSVLPISVFPTPVYEAIACIMLFGVLWLLRNKVKGTLKIFGIFLIFSGLERMLIEQIRVNYKYDWGFIHPTQAEIISVLLMIIGGYLFLFYKEKPIEGINQPHSSSSAQE